MIGSCSIDPLHLHLSQRLPSLQYLTSQLVFRVPFSPNIHYLCRIWPLLPPGSDLGASYNISSSSRILPSAPSSPPTYLSYSLFRVSYRNDNPVSSWYFQIFRLFLTFFAITKQKTAEYGNVYHSKLPQCIKKAPMFNIGACAI